METANDSVLMVSSPKDSLLVTAGKGKLYLIDMTSLETLQTFTTQSEALIVSMKFNNQGDRLGAIDS